MKAFLWVFFSEIFLVWRSSGIELIRWNALPRNESASRERHSEDRVRFTLSPHCWNTPRVICHAPKNLFSGSSTSVFVLFGVSVVDASVSSLDVLLFSWPVDSADFVGAELNVSDSLNCSSSDQYPELRGEYTEFRGELAEYFIWYNELGRFLLSMAGCLICQMFSWIERSGQDGHALGYWFFCFSESCVGSSDDFGLSSSNSSVELLNDRWSGVLSCITDKKASLETSRSARRHLAVSF